MSEINKTSTQRFVKSTLLCTGDINLMNVTDPCVPFRLVSSTLRDADLVFGNLECCLYDPPNAHSGENEGFWALPSAGRALRDAGIIVVGNANNVNYGDAAIQSSNCRLDELGILHCGSGNNAEEAYRPVILERGGLRYGILQRTSVYWPTNHEAGAGAVGVAVIKGHTAYQVPIHKVRPNVPAFNRPGVPPVVVTWADSEHLGRFTADIASLRTQCDVLIASCHWGLDRDVLEYMTEIAHAAIDTGADVVVGHGPHPPLAIEIYRGKPIYYGLGSFSFHSGHAGIQHGDWIGMLARVGLSGSSVRRIAFQFVRHNDVNETVLRAVSEEQEALAELIGKSAPYGTTISVEGSEGVCIKTEPS